MAFIGPVRPTKKKAKASLLRNVRKPNVLERKVSSRRPTKTSTSRGMMSRKVQGPVRQRKKAGPKNIGKLERGVRAVTRAGEKLRPAAELLGYPSKNANIGEAVKAGVLAGIPIGKFDKVGKAATKIPLKGKIAGVADNVLTKTESSFKVAQMKLANSEFITAATKATAVRRKEQILGTLNKDINKIALSKQQTKIMTTGISKEIAAKIDVAKWGTTAGLYSRNSKTISATKKLLIGTGMAVGVIALASKLIGDYIFSSFQIAEGSDKLSIAIYKADEAGLHDLADELTEQQLELTNPEYWDTFTQKIPILNAQQSARKNVAQAKLATEAFSLIREELRSQLTDEQIYDMRQQQRLAADLTRQTNYEESVARIAENKRLANIEGREEEAEFWRIEAEKTRAADIKARDEDAKFWFEYMKAKLELQNKNAPSKLGFGLL